MPKGFLVNLRAKGTKRRSYRARPMRTVVMLKIDNVAGGISKEGVRWRFMLRACWIVKLPRCEYEVTSNIPAAHMGSMRIMHFSSSTLWTVASLHRFGGFEYFVSSFVTTAARSNHLYITI